MTYRSRTSSISSVYWRSAGGVPSPGDRYVDLGVDGDGHQGAVQGVEFVFGGEVFELLGD
ncbi:MULTISPECIES: hypothetical protein [unclassified Streptomyces]|uniref:hypothetical protein n=1 Tax=unclassified Streptomyces TaxID=2593676 RepID=UPI002E2B4832|nr:hypothetical protein [Streptomyces sp. NBC_00273]